MRVVFFDVGQGDSVFIETPNNTQILIDAGKDGKAFLELSKVMPFYDRSIDIVIATHPDEDHIGGFVDVFTRFDTELFLESGVKGNSELEHQISETLDRMHAERVIVQEPFALLLEDGVRIEILFPTTDVSHLESNVASLVVRVVYGEHEFLLTGDAPKAIETLLIETYGDRIQSDVLKVGHHGSKTSSDPLFLDVVQPELAIVSAGRSNRYGHPHDGVVDRFKERNIPLYYTWDGSFSIVSDGVTLSIE